MRTESGLFLLCFFYSKKCFKNNHENYFFTGNGICVDYEDCQCNDNWIGLSCETPTCYDVNNCSSNGLCVSPNNCECFEQYDGENCTESVPSNLNDPVFINASYSAVVSENRRKGFVILTVSANDSDHGRSGEISYSIEEASIANFFTINQVSGEITVAADDVLDYENIPQKQFTFTVTATDNGVPTRSSETTVTVNVKDENDNCPVFSTAPGNYKIPLQIRAEDDDHGDNGHIDYSITEESDPNRKFLITSTGTLSANSTLQPGAYVLIIVAQDRGVPPCPRELTVTILVDEIVSAVILPTSTFKQLMPSSHFSSTMTIKASSSQRYSTATSKQSSPQQSALSSSTMILKPSSPQQYSTVTPEQSLPRHTALSSTTMILEAPSSQRPSTVTSEQSSPQQSALSSSTMMLKPSSLQQYSTVTPEQSLPRQSALSSSTMILEAPSSQRPSTVTSKQSSPQQSALSSSTMMLKPSSLQQYSTVTPEQSLPRQSALSSSTMILEAPSSQRPSTVTSKQSSPQQSALSSSTMMLKPSSLEQYSTVTPEQSLPRQSALSSSTMILEASSSERPSTVTFEQSMLQPTSTRRSGSEMSSTQATTNNKIVHLNTRLLNFGFVDSYRNKDSRDYKNLRAILEKSLLDVFKMMPGFQKIFDVDFERGSVVANIQAEFASESTQVSSSTLARALVQAVDENGNLGELHIDTSFLSQQITPTTPISDDEEDKDKDKDKDGSAYIGATVAIGIAGLFCVVLAVFLVSILI